jgi:hypothetical protein
LSPPSFDHTLAGHGFGPSSPGDSPPAPPLDAHGPSVFYAPTVLACGVTSAAPHPFTAALPATCLPTVPVGDEVSADTLRPPAKPPPTSMRPLPSSTPSSHLCSPSGSLMARIAHDGPLQPAPFDFIDDVDMCALLPDSLRGPPGSGSVNRMITCPCVLGFCGDCQSYACINLTAIPSSQPPGCLIDGGANICLTGDLCLLTDVIAITPIPISAALQGVTTIEDCCTVCGKIPLQLDDGSIYW